MEQITRYDLTCGMPLFVERDEGARSAGMTWLLPAGCSRDPQDRIGMSPMLADWLWRGAGSRNTKELSDALDRIGVQRGTNVETHHLRVGATMIGARFLEALPILVSLVREPSMEDDTFEPVRDLVLQGIAGLRDEPQLRAMVKLKDVHFPPPFNRPTIGTEDGVTALTTAEARAHWRTCARPGGAIMAVCGDVDGNAIAAALNELLSNWSGEVAEPQRQAEPVGGYHHLDDDSSQCHIALAFPAPHESDERSILQRAVTSVMSGGMSGRLFTEVREKRSLCYAVYASYASGRDRGAVQAYAGTTPQRAQETLDVIISEFRRLASGVEPDELTRAIAGMKSRLVMNRESTSARASGMAHDQYLVGRPRTLEELEARIEEITLDRVNSYLGEWIENLSGSIVTLGPEALQTSEAAGLLH